MTNSSSCRAFAEALSLKSASSCHRHGSPAQRPAQGAAGRVSDGVQLNAARIVFSANLLPTGTRAGHTKLKASPLTLPPLSSSSDIPIAPRRPRRNRATPPRSPQNPSLVADRCMGPPPDSLNSRTPNSLSMPSPACRGQAIESWQPLRLRRNTQQPRTPSSSTGGVGRNNKKDQPR